MDKLSDSDLLNFTNDENYPYSYDSSTKEWTSTSQYSYFTTTTMTFSVPESGEYAIEVTSAPTYHNALFYVDDELISEISEEDTGFINLGTIDSTNKVKIEYTTTFYGNSGNNQVIFSVGKITNVLTNKLKCNSGKTTTQIGTSVFNENKLSPAYVGYMYNTVYEDNLEQENNNSLFGKDVSYENGIYTLKDTTTRKDENHHYTCNSTENKCDIVRYYYYGNYYIELNGTENIESALKEMLSNDDVNQKDSTIKSYIDNWYEENMTDYTEYLEDTVFCNDRSIKSLGGWKPDGGSASDYLQFKEYDVSSDLTCTNDIDKFTVSSSIGNGALTYPIGLLTSSEAHLWGENAKNNDLDYWLSSPYVFNNFLNPYLHSVGNCDIIYL